MQKRKKNISDAISNDDNNLNTENQSNLDTQADEDEQIDLNYEDNREEILKEKIYTLNDVKNKYISYNLILDHVNILFSKYTKNLMLITGTLILFGFINEYIALNSQQKSMILMSKIGLFLASTYCGLLIVRYATLTRKEQEQTSIINQYIPFSITLTIPSFLTIVCVFLSYSIFIYQDLSYKTMNFQFLNIALISLTSSLFLSRFAFSIIAKGIDLDIPSKVVLKHTKSQFKTLFSLIFILKLICLTAMIIPPSIIDDQEMIALTKSLVFTFYSMLVFATIGISFRLSNLKNIYYNDYQINHFN